MHAASTVRAALALADTGADGAWIAHELGVPPATVRAWLNGSLPRHVARSMCPRCGGDHSLETLGGAYAYLLGLYLGDGCLSPHPRGVYRLRIVLDAKYPGIIASAAAAIGVVRGKKALTQHRPGHYAEVSAYWKCWCCVFPQHGIGLKHKREIVLADWQRRVVDQYPHDLLRGLIHSDGSRFVSTGRGNWSHPRYAFKNFSADIRSIFCHACDRVGVRWTSSSNDRIYVSRKADVEVLDSFIGPKA